jgi:hypothetical protein
MAFAVLLAIAVGCAGPAPTPAVKPPITDPDTAFVVASRAAEIGGPFHPLEIVAGRFEDLDPESHNAPFDDAAAARWKELANRAVWRVTFAGPGGTESAVIDAETGELLGAVVQGQ